MALFACTTNHKMYVFCYIFDEPWIIKVVYFGTFCMYHEPQKACILLYFGCTMDYENVYFIGNLDVLWTMEYYKYGLWCMVHTKYDQIVHIFFNNLCTMNHELNIIWYFMVRGTLRFFCIFAFVNPWCIKNTGQVLRE